MIKCVKCNAGLEDGAKFCNECGEKINAIAFCENCGNKIDGGAFCNGCGTPVNATSPRIQQRQNVTVNKGKLSKIPFVLMIVVNSILFLIIFNGVANPVNQDATGLYAKNGIDMNVVETIYMIMGLLVIGAFVVGILACVYYYKPKKLTGSIKYWFISTIIIAVIMFFFLIYVSIGMSVADRLSDIYNLDRLSSTDIFLTIIGVIITTLISVGTYIVVYVLLKKQLKKSQA